MVGTVASRSIMESVGFTQLVVWGIGGLVTLLTYFLKGVMDQVKDQEKRLNNLHMEYVKRDDFSDFKDELWKRFDRIETKLDSKPDTK
jgi:hypothetical protein